MLLLTCLTVPQESDELGEFVIDMVRSGRVGQALRPGFVDMYKRIAVRRFTFFLSSGRRRQTGVTAVDAAASPAMEELFSLCANQLERARENWFYLPNLYQVLSLPRFRKMELKRRKERERYINANDGRRR